MSENTSTQVNDEIDRLLGLTPPSNAPVQNGSLETEGLLPLVSILAEADFSKEARPRMDLKQTWERQASPDQRNTVRRPIGIRKPAWAILAAILSILVLVLLMIGPNQVFAAVQKLIGYIPGIGFVQSTEPILVLEEPVIVTQGDVTITVENAVSDGESTRINIDVDGIPNPARFAEQGAATKSGLSFLLPNGERLALKGYSQFFRPAYKLRFDFEALPSGTQEAWLSFTSIPGIPRGAAPENWRIFLSFKPGVMESQIKAATPITIESSPVNGVILKLVNISQEDQKTAIQVQVKTTDERISANSWEHQLVLKDAQGHIVPFFSEQIPSPEDRNTVTFTTPSLDPKKEMVLELNGPIRLFERVANPEEGPAFTFDPGQGAEIGQTWDLNETFHVSGRTIHLKSAQLIRGFNGQPEILFGMTYQKDPLGAMFSSPDSHPEIVGSGNMRLMFNEIPHTPIRLRINGIFYQVDGLWKINWETP